MRILITATVLIFGLAAVLVWQRHEIAFQSLATGEMPPLLEAQDEGPNVRWVDDYFTVEALDRQTFAIGEPRYAQQCYSYLIVGSERAVLFDAGPGYFDIRSVAESLTDKPITFVPSHFHFDHTGNTVTFENIAVVDLPYLRDRAPDNKLSLTRDEHLGFVEGIDNITLEVDEWLEPGGTLSLGDRTLKVLYTPGHTEDSISLLDEENRTLFTGDFIYPGPLFAFLPNSSMGDYVQGADRVLAEVTADYKIWGAHRITPPGAPEVTLQDVSDLRAALDAIKAGELGGEGVFPVTYRINDRIDMIAEPRALQDWR